MHQVSVLAVTPRAVDREALRRIFSSSNWRLDTVDTIADALRHVAENSTPVVLCAEDMPDGPWEKLFHVMGRANPETQIVVISRSPDDTAWGEVLSTGAFDVLPVPLEAAEVLRVIATAWRHWRDLVLRRTGEAGMAAHANEIQ
ncbi:MAG: response regulator [Bryobacterales bacterium]|nr:response regulator [Bryobacterales bacterium]